MTARRAPPKAGPDRAQHPWRRIRRARPWRSFSSPSEPSAVRWIVRLDRHARDARLPSDRHPCRHRCALRLARVAGPLLRLDALIPKRAGELDLLRGGIAALAVDLEHAQTVRLILFDV